MSTITLKIAQIGRKFIDVEMGGVTSVRYAAKRCVEAAGGDSDSQEWHLAHLDGYPDPGTVKPMDMEDVVAEYDGCYVVPHVYGNLEDCCDDTGGG